MRVTFVHGSHRDGFLKIGRVSNGHVHVGGIGLAIVLHQPGQTFVARRQYHHHALPPQAAQFIAQRGEATTIAFSVEIAAKAQVHAMDDQFASTIIDIRHLLHGLDDPGIAAIAVVIQHLEPI